MEENVFSLIVFILQSESLCKSQTLSSSDSETIVKTSPGLNSIPLSEIDKAAVLALIREEVTPTSALCLNCFENAVPWQCIVLINTYKPIK